MYELWNIVCTFKYDEEYKAIDKSRMKMQLCRDIINCEWESINGKVQTNLKCLGYKNSEFIYLEWKEDTINKLCDHKYIDVCKLIIDRKDNLYIEIITAKNEKINIII